MQPRPAAAKTAAVVVADVRGKQMILKQISINENQNR